MAIDFLGKNNKEQEKKNENQEIVMHAAEKQAPVKKIKSSRYVKRLIILAIFVIIIVLVGLAVYFFIIKPAEDINENINIPVVHYEPEIIPDIIPEPESETVIEPEPETGPVILPDTELMPIKGSVVKFSDSSTLYLIEDNGELRKIDLATVRFDNGQKITDINPDLIYTLADKWQRIRNGKDVFGLVDWDPRVLVDQELQPFL